MRLGTLSFEHLTEQEQQELSPALLQRFLASPEGLRLEDLSVEDERDLPYSIKLDMRATAYQARVAAMTIPAELQGWARLMAKRFGPLVKIHQNTLPWLEALMVARYGEEPSSWPAAFSTDDVHRALAWMKGKRHEKKHGRVPFGIQYLDLDDSGFARVKTLLAMATIFMLAYGARILAATLGAIACVVAVKTGQFSLTLPFVVGSALSNFWENELIDHLFRARSYTAPTDHWIALYTAAPGETGGGTEVSGGSYARVQVAAGFANFEGTNGETTNVDSAGTGGATQNRNAITFPAPTANWGNVTHFASLDASTSGNFYFYGALTDAKTVNNGDPAPAFATGDLDFALA